MKTVDQIRALVTRLARLDAGDIWQSDLNPAQSEGLTYLSRANRFSRAPSHVADYLGTTRGTASQTLKALLRKGYLEEAPSLTDKRSISYNVTSKGRAAVDQAGGLEQAVMTLGPTDQQAVADGLKAILWARVRENKGRTFGLCATCRHHQAHSNGAFCELLSLPLNAEEAGQICHEHAPK